MLAVRVFQHPQPTKDILAVRYLRNKPFRYWWHLDIDDVNLKVIWERSVRMNTEATSVFDTWAETDQAEEMQDSHTGTVEVAVNQMDLRAGEVILDLGCGNGWATRMLAGITGGQAIGIDGAANMIDRAKKLSTHYPDISFKHAQFESLPVENAAVNRVFSMEALYFSLDLSAAINEVHRVLKPGGRAEIIIGFYRENTISAGWADELGVPMQWLGESDWVGMFRAAGFDPVDTRRVVDPKGPGREEDFIPDPWFPTWRDRQEFYSQGSLWIRVRKPLNASQ